MNCFAILLTLLISNFAYAASVIKCDDEVLLYDSLEGEILHNYIPVDLSSYGSDRDSIVDKLINRIATISINTGVSLHFAKLSLLTSVGESYANNISLKQEDIKSNVKILPNCKLHTISIWDSENSKFIINNDLYKLMSMGEQARLFIHHLVEYASIELGRFIDVDLRRVTSNLTSKNIDSNLLSYIQPDDEITKVSHNKIISMRTSDKQLIINFNIPYNESEGVKSFTDYKIRIHCQTKNLDTTSNRLRKLHKKLSVCQDSLNQLIRYKNVMISEIYNNLILSSDINFRSSVFQSRNLINRKLDDYNLGTIVVEVFKDTPNGQEVVAREDVSFDNDLLNLDIPNNYQFYKTLKIKIEKNYNLVQDHL